MQLNWVNASQVKNLNSIRNVQRAIEHEVLRQVKIIEAGGVIEQNTLNLMRILGDTSVLRSKEMANDYRYFPDPLTCRFARAVEASDKASIIDASFAARSLS